VDNDISRQNIEESLRGTNESQNSEKEIAIDEASRGIIEEIGNSWLQQATESKARSHAPRNEDVTNFDERVMNIIQESQNERKTSTISVYLKPTTMRGIPLASLIPSPVMRGFYVTKSENDVSSSILADNSTTSYTTTDTPVEQQTETTLISNISTTDKTIIVAHNGQIESRPDTPNNKVNDIMINDKVNIHKEKYSTLSSSVIFSNPKDLSNHKKSDLTTIFVDKLTSRRGKSLRNFDHTTPLSDSYVLSSTTPTRRRIALAVSRYNEATTPLWTGRRIVARKRNRITVSPIKDIIRQIESDSIYATSTLRSTSLTASTLASRRRKLPTISTIPTIPLLISDDSVTSSPEILHIHNNLENSNDTKSKDLENHAKTATLTSSVATPSVSTIIPMTNDSTASDILMFSNNPTIMIIPSVTNVSITTTSSTIAVAKAPADVTITTSATISAGVKTTLNYSVTDNPIIENTNSILIKPTIPFAANTKTEITSTNVNIVPETTQTIATDPVTKSTVANTEVETTSTMTNYSIITIPVTANAQEIATDSANITTRQITTADISVTSTIENYTTIAIPTTISTNDVVTDSANLITAANAEGETSSMIRNYSIFTTTAIKNTTTIPVTTTASPMVISSTMNTHIHATAPMITSNLANANTVTTNMTTPFNVIIPTITDLNVIIPTNANVPTATSEIPLTTIQSKTSFVTSSKAPVTVVTSAVPPILTTESSTVQLANPSTFNISSNSEMSAITATAESTQTTEIPTTFQTPLTFTSTATAFPKTLPTNFEASLVTTAALSTQEDESFSIPMVIQTPSISSMISSRVPVMNTVVTSTSSASTTLATESSTIHLANSNNLNISNNSEILAITATAESTQTTEIPTTFEVLPTFTSTAFPKILPSTNFEASSVVTAALSTQEDESVSTPMVIQTPSTPLSIVTSITNKAVASEKSTDSTTLSTITGESITTSSTIRTTINVYEPNSVQTISEKSIMPEQKTNFKKATSMETQSRIENQITTTINKLSSARTSNEFTIPEINVSEEIISKATESQKQNQTTSEFNTTNYQPIFNQRTTRRRIVNRTNNWLGSPITLQRTNQYPQHRITYRERSRRPLTYISSSNMVEKNRKRRIRQKRIRINSEAFNRTIMPEQNIRNITENHAYDQIKNIRRKVVLKKIDEKETTTVLPTEETTVFLQSSITIENTTFQAHHENENIEEQQKVILKKIKQSQESFAMKETNTNSNSTNESLPNNTQSNLHTAEGPSELENSKKIMKIILKNVRLKSEEKNPIEEVSVDSDSINTNLQDNFPESSYTDKNLSDKRIAGKRMRVVLKSVRPKSEENSTIEETNVNPDSINKNLQNNNLLNNFNINQNFSNEEKTRKRMRVVLKRIKSKSEKETKTEEANTEYNSINESLQATFSNNFYSTTNLPIKYRTGRRMRVVLKSIKPKSEEKNSTIEEITVDSDSINENIEGTFSNNFRSGKNFPIEYGTRKRMRVVLKSVKPKSEKRNPSTVEEMSIDSDSTDKDLQGSFSSNFHMNENFSDEEEARRRMKVVLKSIQTKSKEKDSVAEETSVDSDFAKKDPRVLYTSHFSSNLHVGDNLLDKKKKHSKSEEEEAMTEWPEDTESQTMETSVPVKEDTDRSLLEVSATLNRRSLP